MIIDYLRNKVDPLFVPLMRSLIHNRPDDVASYCIDYLKPFQKKRIVFVLGGPGSGKGTQCAKLAEELGFLHTSAGDLLRAEVASGSETAALIDDYIRNGKIVPGHITVSLLKKVIDETDCTTILVDGFPRAVEQAFEFIKGTGLDCDMLLFFDCPEDVLEKRLLKRGETSGRTDDNLTSIKKRFATFKTQTAPVIDAYEAQGKVKRVDGSRGTPDEIFQIVKSLF